MDDHERAMAILQANQDKSFVKRILTPDAYPTLDLGNGSHATHQMAWGQLGDQYVVYPQVLMNPQGALQDYGADAWNHVSKSGNYVTFDNPDDASWFSENYKHGWGGKPNNWPK